MIATMARLDVVAQNLANVNTTGYKRDGFAFEESLARTVRAQGGGGAALGQMAGGPKPTRPYTDFAAGAVHSTGNPLDVAIAGERGMFAVMTPNGVAYTRNGSFTLSQGRELVTQSGEPVLDDQGQTILVPEGEAVFDEQGYLQVDGSPVARLGVVEGTFDKLPTGGSLYRSTDAQSAWDGDVALRTRALESSNVNPIEEMVAMIELNRSFEMNQRSVSTQDEATSRLIQGLMAR